jgi:hypothetical protein
VLSGVADHLEAQVRAVFTLTEHGVVSKRTHLWSGLLMQLRNCIIEPAN